MTLPWILCALGLLLGAFMGVAMLVRPRQSHLSIGLGSIPEKSGGVGESRAFGGLLLGAHSVCLWALAQGLSAGSGDGESRIATIFMVTVLAVGWLFAFLGRLLSVVLDREGLSLNLRLLALDAAMTILLFAPFAVAAPYARCSAASAVT